ncbi:MAG: PilZ domain-containing protein [Pirellulales bacterium]
MATEIANEQSPANALFELVVDAERELKQAEERRATPRFPFFRPVWVRVAGGERRHAFSREISADGAGLMHGYPLEPGEVELSIVSRAGFLVNVVTRIEWCRSCGDDWYISGGRFLRLGGIGE